jgi:hypothetical protein
MADRYRRVKIVLQEALHNGTVTILYDSHRPIPGHLLPRPRSQNEAGAIFLLYRPT